MAKTNKFSAFAGVYTPSLLTILGVIMYMRLGWVVGEAGLFNALLIIVAAHIISVTTGLSISSIATDKKVKAGGIYYMLSRSLGLPMGGAIGIALFVGTALSISMYVIGFSESFLSIPSIQQWLHLEPSVDAYRIVGTVVLIILAVVAFISTSLAVKSQFLILGAIVLSLVSLGVGFFLHPSMGPEQPVLQMAGPHVSLEYVFAIFFPAVTGFTAGVAMSGDLRNPKKAIPIGTLLSIFTGFVVYVGLAIGFAWFVNRETLINDTDVAMKIAWIPALVVAGIWGATLSSALGGILGGPRILQAIAHDRLLPRFLAKGYGAGNEPRNALLLIFVIAELGVLKGDLNAVAAIVTMFYLATYGFINLSYFLESWASTDFRPSFKIAKSIAVIGFLAAFVIMFRLNMPAMITAFVIMGGIYLILRRKEAKLEYGDIWQSVWNSIIKKGLQFLSKHPPQDRNWTPNIVLFSRDDKEKKQLVELGKNLTGHYGMLSVFELVESADNTVLFPKHQQNKNIHSFEQNKNWFERRLSCRTIYDGIEMVVRAFGFTGIEPNTVIMEWERNSRQPERFFELIRVIRSLDYSLLLLDYDEQIGFGQKKTIDIWWRGGNNNGHLSLLFSKLLSLSSDWNQARIRLLTVSDDASRIPYIQRKIDAILSKLRINAESKIINNQIERRPINDIIRIESKDTDLVFIGLPDQLNSINAEAFISGINSLINDIGTVILVRVASIFKKETLLVSENVSSTILSPASNEEVNVLLPPLTETLPSPIHIEISTLFETIFTDLSAQWAVPIMEEQAEYTVFLNKIKEIQERVFSEFLKNIDKIASDKFSAYLSKRFQSIIDEIDGALLSVQESLDENMPEILDATVRYLEHYAQTLFSALPDTLTIEADANLLSVLHANGFISSFTKQRKQILARHKKQVKVSIGWRRRIKQELSGEIERIAYDSIYWHSRLNMQFLLSIRYFAKHLQNIFSGLRHDSLSNRLTAEKIEDANRSVSDKWEELVHYNSQLKNIQLKPLRDNLQALRNRITTYFLQVADKPVDKISVSQLKQYRIALQSFSSVFVNNMSLAVRTGSVENRLLVAESLITTYIKECVHRLRVEFEQQFVNIIDAFIVEVERMKTSRKIRLILPESLAHIEPLKKYMARQIGLCRQRVEKAGAVLPEYVEVSEWLADEMEKYADKPMNTVKLPIRQIMRFLLNDTLVPMTESFESELINLLAETQNSFLAAYRLIGFTAEEKITDEEFETFLTERIDILQNSRNELLKSANELRLSLLRFANDLTTHLTLYGLKKMAPGIKSHMLQTQKQTARKQFKQYRIYLVQWLQRQIVRLRYGKTQTTLYEQRPFATRFSADTVFLSLSQQLHAATIESLPFYYRQLFLSKQVFYNEFFAGHEHIVSLALKVFDQYHHKQAGALLIAAENHVGKSFFAYHVASLRYETNRIYFIQPPAGGTTDEGAMVAAIQTATGIDGAPEFIFKTLPKSSVFIFDDLERWWIHRAGGDSLLQRLIQWTEQYTAKHLFIFTANRFFLPFLKRQTGIDRLLLSTIELPAMKIESMRQSIFLRHKAANLQFTYKNTSEQHLSEMQIADLMLKIYRFSYGNIGVSLALWIYSMQKKHTGEYEITIPSFQTDFPFEKLDKLEQLVLYQLIIHGELTQNRLIALFPNNDKESVIKAVKHLYYIGLLQQTAAHIYSIDILWYMAVVNYFTKQKRL